MRSRRAAASSSTTIARPIVCTLSLDGRDRVEHAWRGAHAACSSRCRAAAEPDKGGVGTFSPKFRRPHAPICMQSPVAGLQRLSEWSNAW